jgi:hypothetical protein
MRKAKTVYGAALIVAREFVWGWAIASHNSIKTRSRQNREFLMALILVSYTCLVKKQKLGLSRNWAIVSHATLRFFRALSSRLFYA